VRPGVFNDQHPHWGDDHHYETHFNGNQSPYENLSEHVAPRWKVTGSLDIKPGHQGTFPQENWNRYKDQKAPAGYDANHPSDHDPDSYTTADANSSTILAKARATGDPDAVNRVRAERGHEFSPKYQTQTQREHGTTSPTTPVSRQMKGQMTIHEADA
jgi:ribosomal protein L35